MSYLVLARKYRPKNFAEMVGQDHVVRALTNALTSQRLHHAYLFTGTRGVGKTTVSRILAKSLNCVGSDGQGGITAEPCGVCEACVAIDAGRFIDYTELDAASNRRVEEVQELLDQAVYKPVQGRFKVFMIDEVHMLSTTAFNVMLKTLEEPPEYLKFVLATTDPQKVPVTVLSRCLQFNLRPMAAPTITEHLAAILQNENIAADARSLSLLSQAARGSMRDALSLTDQAIAYGAGSLQEADVRQMLGAVDRSVAMQIIEALAQSDGLRVATEVDNLRSNGYSAASTLDEICAILQRMAVLQLASGAKMVDDQLEDITRLADMLPVDETQMLYSMCLQGRAELGLAPDEYAALTMVLLRLLAFKSPLATGATGASDIGDEKKKHLANPLALKIETRPASQTAEIERALPLAASSEQVAAATHPPAPQSAVSQSAVTQTATQSTVPQSAVSQSAAPEASPISQLVRLRVAEMPGSSDHLDSKIEAIAADANQEGWLQLVQQLLDAEKISALTREIAIQSQCVTKTAQYATLRVEQQTLNNEAALDKLQNALADIGFTPVLRIELGPVTDSYAKRVQAAQAARFEEAKALITQDPLTQMLMREFNAKIVAGSIQVIDS